MYAYRIKKHQLVFNIPAKTSRNTFKTRDIYLIRLSKQGNAKIGIGEAAPLSLLSVDDIDNYEEILHQKLTEFCQVGNVDELELHNYPSINFGLETALLSLQSKGNEVLYATPFTKGETAIPINGLVWMSDTKTMLEEAFNKIEAGFNVIKFKVGAQDFDDECRMLEEIRKKYSAFKITLRLDANGAFKPDEAAEQLSELNRFEIHSIEQPIMPKQWDAMAKLCAETKVDIALDEELIGCDLSQGDRLLNAIKPQYLILKPNLIGGLANATCWVKLAEKHNIGWWATSALESNVGLNAIAQWVSQYDNLIHQGLGTGALFKNNIATNLVLKNGFMRYKV